MIFSVFSFGCLGRNTYFRGGFVTCCLFPYLQHMCSTLTQMACLITVCISRRLIDSMKLKCEELKLQIERQNKEIASLLTENEQLKEALRGGAGYVIGRNNKEIQSLKEEIWQLQKAYEESQSLHISQEIDRLVDKLL